MSPPTHGAATSCPLFKNNGKGLTYVGEASKVLNVHMTHQETEVTLHLIVHQKPVIATSTRLFNETSEALGGNRANPAKKQEIEDNLKKLGALFARLNSGDISKNEADKLTELCKALEMGDFSTILQIQNSRSLTKRTSDLVHITLILIVLHAIFNMKSAAAGNIHLLYLGSLAQTEAYMKENSLVSRVLVS